jgi:hypothetical protein
VPNIVNVISVTKQTYVHFCDEMCEKGSGLHAMGLDIYTTHRIAKCRLFAWNPVKSKHHICYLYFLTACLKLLHWMEN